MLEQSRSFEKAGTAAGATRRRFGLGILSFWGLVIGGLIVCALAPAANAQSQAHLLDAPRAAGIVGERYDGFAVIRGAASPGIAALVDKVNAERRAVYAQRAASDKAPVEAVGKIYAAEIIKSAPPGTWFLSEAGQWSRK